MKQTHPLASDNSSNGASRRIYTSPQRSMPRSARWLLGKALPTLVSNADREELTMTALGAGTALSTLHTFGRPVLLLHGHKHFYERFAPRWTDVFVNDAYQPAPVAESEARRGTSDATYGYYTMGKLMILKLREDYKAKKGAAYSLEDFHDTFIKLGPLPLPLIRKAMLGETGNPF